MRAGGYSSSARFPRTTDRGRWRSFESGDGPHVVSRRGCRYQRACDRASDGYSRFELGESEAQLDGSRPYDLRPAFCSLLIAEGLSVVEIAEHARPAEDVIRQAREAASGARESLRVEPNVWAPRREVTTAPSLALGHPNRYIVRVDDQLGRSGMRQR